jgi:hypothetical protein
MIDKNEVVMGRTILEWEKLSAELDKSMAGAPENTEPLSPEEVRWFRRVLADKAPKVKVTIRLHKWQIDRAKRLAKERGMRGYQTLLDQIITHALMP